MHEVDMTKALLLTVRDWWDRQPNRPQISKIHLTVGDFTCVEPASLQFAFEAQVKGTFLAGAELAIATTPLVGFCHSCQAEYHPKLQERYACPHCGAPLEDIRSGRELKIDRLELVVPDETGPSVSPSVRIAPVSM